MPVTVYTVGHSTHPIEELLGTLKAHGIERLVDVRTVPKSRRNPQFETTALAASLSSEGIQYQHMPGLGGLRHPLKNSTNLGWKNASFRGYADYMQAPAFASNLSELMELAAKRRTVIMCAEAVPWRCHRSLIADALMVNGAEVEHILTANTRRPHTYTPFARLEAGRVTYPGLPLTEGPPFSDAPPQPSNDPES
jgi:uncharacterized protein (DUF488 family)